ncbi:MAG: VWA domain-containing protein [Hylemonella sp.]|nr:VWA domain-containing protein [Hylemonella sp.]
MLIDFFYTLRAAKLPVSVKEYLTLLEALKEGVVGPNFMAGEPDDGAGTSGYALDDFYYLSRTTLVKDEKHYDKFDRAFAAYFKGVELLTDFTKDIPLEWLRKNLELNLSPEEKAVIEKMGWDELMETLKKRFEEQKERHEGGSKWIGTGGTSPFGANGYNPQGIRIGQDKSRNKSAIKVWDQRAYKDYDDTQELGTRNIKVALRRLRKFAREGHEDELDLDNTIRKTAENAGYLDIRMRPERHNNVKVLLLMDVGGTMDEHIARVEELFSASKTEFKHLEFYYFHNCVYDFMWKNNRRRYSEKFATWDIIRKYNKDYKLIFVGDATMSPYEILQPGGSVEYNNEEAGAEWLQRLTNAFPKFAWINPEPQGVWQYRQSISIIQQLTSNRMYPLTIKGIEEAMRLLTK